MADVIFPAALALQALRSSSYKDTAHAVAELVDNSVDAGARYVSVALLVDQNNGQPHTIAVLDNGVGMSEEELKKCVQYGFSKPGQSSRMPLGRYGVGLVAASFSQCSDLRVMSWKNGKPAEGRVPSTQIRIPADRELREEDNMLPAPHDEEFPPWAYRAFVGMPESLADMPSGTLVVWTDVKATWKKPKTLRQHLLDLCGRIYRGLISERLNIFINIFNTAGQDEDTAVDNETVQPVDPLFLRNWNHPALSRFGYEGDTTLFIPYTGLSGDTGKNQSGNYEAQLHKIKINAEIEGNCRIMASYRNPLVVERLPKDKDPGDEPYGQLAKNLQGVSIMRAGREIALDPNWLRVSQTVDRWLSVSVDFDSSLDDVFGVSNDKQSASRLASFASMTLREIKEKIEELKQDSDCDKREQACLEVAREIKKLLSEMQQLVKKQRRGSRGGDDDDQEDSKDPSHATDTELKETGEKLSSGPNEMPYDNVAPGDYPQETTDLYEGCTTDGSPSKEKRPAVVMEANLKIDAAMDEGSLTSKIFELAEGPGHILLRLTAGHPLSGVLSQLLTPQDELPEGTDPPTVQAAVKVVRTLLFSYARAQVEASHESPTAKAEFERCTQKWGEVAERAFSDEE